jgi:hypothetical protein
MLSAVEIELHPARTYAPAVVPSLFGLLSRFLGSSGSYTLGHFRCRGGGGEHGGPGGCSVGASTGRPASHTPEALCPHGPSWCNM